MVDTTSLNRHSMAWRPWWGIVWQSFRDIVSLFRSQDAVRIVGPAELPLVLLELLAERSRSGDRSWSARRRNHG